MAVKLNLLNDHAQMETELGVIDIWQIEGGELFTVEIFPNNQSEESFEKGEFTNVWNALEVAVNMDFVKFTHRPKEWNWKQVCDMEQNAVTLIFSEMLSTIQNLEDLKEVKLKDGTEVYDSLKVIRNKYNNNYCSFCGKEITEDNSEEYAEDLYCCETCFRHEQTKIHLSDDKYDELYEKGEEFLIKVAEDNGWVQNEIFEENLNSGKYKYGLTLVGYEDDNHEVECGIVSIDLANLDLFIK